MAHYQRWLDNQFVKHLQGKYDFLLECSYRKEGNYKFDIQFRPNNEIMIYYGGTCLLTVCCDAKGQIRFISKSYEKKHNKEFAALQNDSKNIKKACFHFLDTAAANVTPKWNSVGSEGYWEQRISRLWGGKAWQGYMDLLVIDRQAVISFNTNKQKSAFYASIKQKYINIAKALSSANKWKTKKTFGDELDLLAIGPGNELVCIELKTAKKDQNFYYAPIQAAAYCEAFEAAAKTGNPDFSNDIKKIVKQKVKLGLLPESALKRLPKSNFEKIRSDVLIMDSSELSLDSEVWNRLTEVIEKIEKPYRPLIKAIP